MIKKSKYKAGDVFGFFTLVQDTGKRSSNGGKIWLCRCRCGALEEREVSILVQNQKKKNNVPKCRKCFAEKMSVYDIGGRFADDPERKAKAIEARGQVEGTALCQITDKRKLNRNNSTGFRGISKLKDGRYRVRLGFKNITVCDTTRATLEEALQTRKEMEAIYYAPIMEKYQEEQK